MSTVDIFAPCDSIKERFPKLEDGLELVEAIFDLYCINRSAQISFWDKSKRSQLIVCHELNCRKQDKVLAKYAA